MLYTVFIPQSGGRHVNMEVEGSAPVGSTGVGLGVGGTGNAGGRGGAGRWLLGDMAFSRRRDGMEMKSPLVDGLFSDWEQVCRGLPKG